MCDMEGYPAGIASIYACCPRLSTRQNNSKLDDFDRTQYHFGSRPEYARSSSRDARVFYGACQKRPLLSSGCYLPHKLAARDGRRMRHKHRLAMIIHENERP